MIVMFVAGKAFSRVIIKTIA